MSNNDLARLSKRVVQYFWDPLPKNEDNAPIWCLGRMYDSRYHATRSPSHQPQSSTPPQPALQDSERDERSLPTVDATSGLESMGAKQNETAENGLSATAKDQVDLTRSEEESLGWPPEFLDDLNARIWLTYRNNFPPIAKSTDPAAASAMSFSTKLRNLGSQGGFTSDTGWGCMIRSGQSLLANTLAELKLGRDWRKGQKNEEHNELLALFADTPEAPFSVHKFVEHGAQACGKHPGEWFGPSATARCLRALTDKYSDAGLRVYSRPDDGDVYVDSVIATATAKDADDQFQPTLIVLGIRLGIDRITPVYHHSLKTALELPQTVGIAGGRPSSSHYFIGHQSDQFFYLDPHSTRPALPLTPTPEDVDTCHTRRVRRLDIAEMDPSMLIGFLIRSRDDFEQWRRAVTECPEGKAIIHVHDKEPTYALGVERPGAIDEVETWVETGDEAKE